MLTVNSIETTTKVNIDCPLKFKDMSPLSSSSYVRRAYSVRTSCPPQESKGKAPQVSKCRLYIGRLYNRVANYNKVKNSLTFPWPLNSFHWRFINEKQPMFTFALAFLQAIDRYFSLHFQPFQLFVESGRRNLEESIHNENYWPQPLHVPGAECQIDRFAAYFSSFPKKMHFKILKKNLSKPENRIPWLFTDFDSIKDFRWLFPDLEKLSFLPDFSLTVATLI